MIAIGLGIVTLAIWAYLLGGRGGFWHHAPALLDYRPPRWPVVVAVIPARDEAAGIARCVASLLGQDYPGRLGIVVVDDHSSDGTAELARQAATSLGATERLRVIAGQALATGWTGKLWAVAQGLDAAAAGGCMLVRQRALARIEGVTRFRGAVIDDCALAAAVKPGGPIWLGFARRTRSLRVYPKLGDIWAMVARTAYVQLDHSPLLLVLTVIGMVLAYLAPPALVVAAFRGGSVVAALLGALAWAAMSLAYAPTLRRYGRPLAGAPLLPLVALFYTAATLGSGWRHYRGRGGAWKGRVYAGGGP
jgi:hypothetical protein